MKLSRIDFEHRYNEGSLRLAFIGMSNIGKSYTAKRLAKQFNFSLVEIDQLIWETLGYSDMGAFANWQGQPYSEGYAERETRSIELETEATLRALNTGKGNVIVDTPGSVIYTGAETLRELRETHLIIYISASDARVEGLKADYFKNPKPLIWQKYFHQRVGQSSEEAILESYPALLEARSKQYEALADQTLTDDFVLDEKTSVEQIFEALKPAV